MKPSKRFYISAGTWLILVTILALGVRLWFVLERPFRAGDSLTYHAIAYNIRTHGAFSLDAEPPLAPTYRRAPLYPAWLSLLYSASYSDRIVHIAQALLSTLTIPLLYLLGRATLPDHRGPLIACLMLALYIHAAAITATVLTETLRILFVVASVLVLTRAAGARRPWYCLAAGLLFGAATLLRPTDLSIGLAAALVLFLVVKAPASRLLRTLLFLAGLAACVLPWSMRNLSLFGTPALEDPNDPCAMAAVDCDMYHRGEFDEIWAEAEAERLRLSLSHPSLKECPGGARSCGCAFLKAKFLDDPLGFVKDKIACYPHLWIDMGDQALGTRDPFTVLLEDGKWDRALLKGAQILVFVVLLGLAARGVVTLYRARDRGLAFLLLVPICVGLVYLPTSQETRYAMPAWPFLFLLAAHGLRGRGNMNVEHAQARSTED